MKIFIAQNKDNNIYISDTIENIPPDPIRTHIFVINDNGQKREIIINLKKHNLKWRSDA